MRAVRHRAQRGHVNGMPLGYTCVREKACVSRLVYRVPEDRKRAAWPNRVCSAACVLVACGLPHAGLAQFSGTVVLEVLEDLGVDHKLKLLHDVSFRDTQGRVWRAPQGAVLDGWSIPRELRAMPGLPLENEYLKSAVVHDYHSRAKTAPWRDVHRMLYSAALAEGIPPAEANVLYMTVYASGWRWEPKPSSCYGSCHAAAALLTWRPDVKAAEIAPIADWLQQSFPTLDEIEQRVDARLKRPGPHLFAQVRQ